MRVRIEIDSEKWGPRAVHLGDPPEPLPAGSPPPPVQGTPVISSPSTDTEVMWETIKGGRQRWLDGVEDADATLNDRRTYWIGGAIAVFAAATGQPEEDVHARLLREMPQEGADAGSIPVQPRPEELERSGPHPGAQRVVQEEDPEMEAAESPIPEYTAEPVEDRSEPTVTAVEDRSEPDYEDIGQFGDHPEIGEDGDST